jgi:hypothetical protein
MSIQPTTHDMLKKEFNEILSPFKAESISDRCIDIVVRERMKILSLKSLTDEQMGTIALNNLSKEK